MALGDSERDAEYALSKLLQIGTVAEYHNEFEMLINRVTRIAESLLKTSNPTTLGEAFFKALITEARFENKNNQAIDNNVGDQEDPNVNDEQEVKNVDDQEIENVKDEKGKNVKDEQVSEQTINETACIITSLQSEMEKLPMELQLNNNFREALETRSKGLEKKRLDLNPMLHDLQKVAAAQKKKKMEAEIQRRIWNPEIKIAFQDNTLRARRFRRSE
ncbi:hypothetical protein Tco_0947152, partial [Tanacetum coccineum]